MGAIRRHEQTKPFRLHNTRSPRERDGDEAVQTLLRCKYVSNAQLLFHHPPPFTNRRQLSLRDSSESILYIRDILQNIM